MHAFIAAKFSSAIARLILLASLPHNGAVHSVYRLHFHHYFGRVSNAAAGLLVLGSLNSVGMWWNLLKLPLSFERQHACVGLRLKRSSVFAVRVISSGSRLSSLTQYFNIVFYKVSDYINKTVELFYVIHCYPLQRKGLCGTIGLHGQNVSVSMMHAVGATSSQNYVIRDNQKSESTKRAEWLTSRCSLLDENSPVSRLFTTLRYFHPDATDKFAVMACLSMTYDLTRVVAQRISDQIMQYWFTYCILLSFISAHAVYSVSIGVLVVYVDALILVLILYYIFVHSGSNLIRMTVTLHIQM